MSKKKMTPAQKAAARREVTPEEKALAAQRAEERAAKRSAADQERRMGTKSERLTKRMFTTVQVVLVLIPFALLGFNGLMGGDIQTVMQEDAIFAVSFLIAMVQPFVAWILRFVYKHHAAGEDGYALGNLVGLLCAEICLRNMVGIIGCLLLVWRVWRKAPNGVMAAWARERKIGGVLFDNSGALAVFLLSALCAFAAWRVGI